MIISSGWLYTLSVRVMTTYEVPFNIGYMQQQS